MKSLVHSLTNLAPALDAGLPSESAVPPLERTVLVSFRHGTNWVTRTYDFEHQPAALRKLHQIIGERWELIRKQNDEARH